MVAKHGMSDTSTYHIWEAMINRCRNTTFRQYKDYGGRGIRVCRRWLRFENFLADMGERPDGLQLDRIDNNGDYSPENCRWASRQENQLNTRKGNSSGYPGVERRTNNSFRARIRVDGAYISCGHFSTAKAAYDARMKKMQELGLIGSGGTKR